MKILVMGGYPIGNRRSGSITHAQKLAQSLSERDNTEVHFITMGSETSQFKNGNLSVYVISSARMLASLLLRFTPWSVQHKVKEFNPDVIHVMGGRFPYALIAAPLRGRYPMVMSVFSFAVLELRFEKNPLFFMRMWLLTLPSMRYVIPRMKHIIVQSPFTGKAVGVQSKAIVHIIPEGVEYQEFQREPDVSIDDPPDIFLAVGFRKLKGLDILLRAFSIVVKSVPDVKLYLAGSGEEEAQLRGMVKELALDSNVRFLGFISDERKIYQYYKASKIAVVPSRWDVEPFAALHGAASGKPIIASKDSHTSLVVEGKTGYLFDTENFEELASRLVELLTNDKLRAEMGEAAREKAKEYDWNRIAARTLEVYQEVIADFQKRKV